MSDTSLDIEKIVSQPTLMRGYFSLLARRLDSNIKGNGTSFRIENSSMLHMHMDTELVSMGIGSEHVPMSIKDMTDIIVFNDPDHIVLLEHLQHIIDVKVALYSPIEFKIGKIEFINTIVDIVRYIGDSIVNNRSIRYATTIDKIYDKPKNILTAIHESADLPVIRDKHKNFVIKRQPHATTVTSEFWGIVFEYNPALGHNFDLMRQDINNVLSLTGNLLSFLRAMSKMSLEDDVSPERVINVSPDFNGLVIESNQQLVRSYQKLYSAVEKALNLPENTFNEVTFENGHTRQVMYFNGDDINVIGYSQIGHDVWMFFIFTAECTKATTVIVKRDILENDLVDLKTVIDNDIVANLQLQLNSAFIS